MSKSEATGIRMTTLRAIGTIGPGDRDINGAGSNGALRGPFTITRADTNNVPTYPVLWSHEALRERTMSFPGDSEGRPRRGETPATQAIIDARVSNIFGTASHCHFNRDFRFNSQSTAMQFTPYRTIGGRAWPSITLPSPEQEKALVLWSNTSLGLLLYWWYANKTQPGRGSILRTKLGNLPILDVTELTKQQLDQAAEIFDETCNLELLPFHQINIDKFRRTIDERFGCEILDLPNSLFAPEGAFELVRRKLAAEPSIRGNKENED